MSVAEVEAYAHRGGRASRPMQRVRPVACAEAGTVIRAAVVHGDALLRAKVAGALGHDGDIAVVGVGDVADVPAALAPDVVVVAHRLPGPSAVVACETLRRDGAGPAVVVVAANPRAALLRRAIQAGASALVAADSPASVLRDAVRSAAAGRPYFDPALGGLVVELASKTSAQRRPYGLTRAQLDVVALLPKGLRNREIAAELGITENTVKTHLRHSLRKLGVRDRAQAAALVVREGLAQ